MVHAISPVIPTFRKPRYAELQDDLIFALTDNASGLEIADLTAMSAGLGLTATTFEIEKCTLHANVKIVTLLEGEVTPLHVCLKGTTNAPFLKDLADKTRRGLCGRIEIGKPGGENY